MMVPYLLTLCMALSMGAPRKTRSELRDMYFKAGDDKEMADALLASVADVQESDKPEFVAYRGMASFAQANHQQGPMNKLKLFKQGRQWLEKAIVRSPQDLELRFLRFTIQSSVPSALKYSADLDEDKAFILAGFPQIKDPKLRSYVKDFMCKSGRLTEKEEMTLKKQ